MKVFYSKNEPELNGYIHVSNNQTLNMLVEDNEADEIIVDNMLGQVPFHELPNYYGSLLAKLRVGGRLVIYYTDFDLVSMQYEKGSLDIQNVGNVLMTPGTQSIVNEHVVLSLIGDSLKIEKQDFNDKCQGIIVGVRE